MIGIPFDVVLQLLGVWNATAAWCCRDSHPFRGSRISPTPGASQYFRGLLGLIGIRRRELLPEVHGAGTDSFVGAVPDLVEQHIPEPARCDRSCGIQLCAF